MKVFKAKLLKPLLLAVSVMVFAIVKFNRKRNDKKIEKNFKKSVDKQKTV